jgi:hypothetical protein
MSIAFTLAGVTLIAIAAIDLFTTVLLVRGGLSIVSPFVTRGVWWLFRHADRRLGLDGRLMLLAGPILLVLIVLVWALLLMIGFALLYLPMLGDGVTATSGATDQSFWTALYFSGTTFPTLGPGDVAGVSATARMLTVVEACTGFGAVTLAISYTLSIYNAVSRHDSFALHLHGGSDETGWAAMTLAGLCPDGAPDRSTGDSLEQIAERTYELLQIHESYPLARYYRRRRPEFSSARIAFHLLDLVTLAKALFADGKSARLLHARGFISLRHAAFAFVEMSSGPLSGAHPECWRKHFDRSLACLSRRGITVPDAKQAWRRYAEMRRRWDGRARRLAEHMGYSYETIADPSGTNVGALQGST